MKLLFPLLLAIAGLGGGLAAGVLLRPAAEPAISVAAGEEEERRPEAAHAKAGVDYDYVKLNRQFVVPLVEHDAVSGLMVLSLSLEVDPGLSDEVFRREPKLRDAFLQVLFLHAQSGAFNGVFTAGPAMRDLRGALRAAARDVLGPAAHEVLVTEIIRQDL